MASKTRVFTQTVTPGKRGIHIEKAKYEPIHDAILAVLKERKEIQFADLSAAVSLKLKSGFEGNISWYATTVKLDMERRRIIERVPGSKPQVLRMRRKVK